MSFGFRGLSILKQVGGQSSLGAGIAIPNEENLLIYLDAEQPDGSNNPQDIQGNAPSLSSSDGGAYSATGGPNGLPCWRSETAAAGVITGQKYTNSHYDGGTGVALMTGGTEASIGLIVKTTPTPSFQIAIHSHVARTGDGASTGYLGMSMIYMLAGATNQISGTVNYVFNPNVAYPRVDTGQLSASGEEWTAVLMHSNIGDATSHQFFAVNLESDPDTLITGTQLNTPANTEPIGTGLGFGTSWNGRLHTMMCWEGLTNPSAFQAWVRDKTGL